jgi:hypothetical protein
VTKEESARVTIDLDAARAAWERFEAGCAGLLASKCSHHRPYLGCPLDCGDVENAIGQEWEIFRPLVGPLFDEITTLRSIFNDLGLARLEQRIRQLEMDHERAEKEAARLKKYEDAVQKALEQLSEKEAVALPYDGCGFMFDYDDDTRTHHLFVSRDDRSVTLDVRHFTDLKRGVHSDEGSITCAIHIPSLRRLRNGQPSEDVHEHVIPDPIQEEDLIDALRWLVGDCEMPARAHVVVTASKEIP